MKRLTFHFYTYVLLSLKDKEFYIGSTDNLKRRLTQHSHGKVDATRYRLPLKLIYYEYFVNQEDAEAREKFLKSGYGHRQLKEIIKRTLKGEWLF